MLQKHFFLIIVCMLLAAGGIWRLRATRVDSTVPYSILDSGHFLTVAPSSNWCRSSTDENGFASLVFTTNETWQAYWRTQEPSKPIPSISFSTHMVILLLRCRGTPSSNLEIKGIIYTPQEVTISLHLTTSVGPDMIATPFLLMRVPLSRAPVRIVPSGLVFER